MTLEEKLEKFHKRPLSWSSYSSFLYDKEEWYRKYILDEREPPSKEMIFGSRVGKRLEKDPTFLPQIIRYDKMEHPFSVIFAGIPLIGYADTFCTVTNKKLGEFKTSRVGWDQKKVDGHHQLTMYLLMHYITTKVKPEDVEITLWEIPTVKTEDGEFNVKIDFLEPLEENIKFYKTKRTMTDILSFGAEIKKVYKQMEEFIKEKEGVELA